MPPTPSQPPAADPAYAPFTGDRGFFGHPRGLSTLFFTEMWERFSYYGIRPLLVLYMTAAVTSGGFGFERAEASSIVGIYAASVYLASLPGGWVADRWLGLQRAVWFGGIFIAAGHLAIALSIVFAHSAFFIGLVLIVMGTGLLKGNVAAIVGELYPAGGARRDAGFSIFYMGINSGALIAPIVTGFLGERVGWHFGFGAAGIAMFIGLFVFRARAAATLGPIGRDPSGTPAQQARVRSITLLVAALIAGLVLLGLFGVVRFSPVAIASNMTTVMLSMSALYFLYLFFGAGLTGEEKKRILVVVVLFIFSMIFWAAFEQSPTSLNLFARDFTERQLGGWEIPASWFQSIEPFFVVTLAPAMAALWIWLEKRGFNLSSPSKFAFGLASAGIGFVAMLVAANAVLASGGALRVSPLWLVFCFFTHGVGELALSPVGLSSMTSLAPRRLIGQMMGVWYTSIALGNLFAGIVGGSVDPSQLEQAPLLFKRTAISLFIASAILLALVIPIRRLTQARTGSGSQGG
ncbi:MAG: peptide MFS transporter [Gemmatimonadaceae bacterium]|nr:peptide MFS transporter [Gemmatimonadaceae bacterium]